MRRWTSSLRGAGLALLCLAAAPAAGAEESAVATFRLDNGMEAVVIPDRRAPVVTHMVWYKVGSADDPAGQSGVAHFLEHLMFKGTTNHPAGEFSAAVDAIGGEENAFTSNDYTAYFQRVAPEALGTMMEFEADRMRNVVLNEEIVRTERDVVLEERRSRVENSPQALLAEETDATLFQNHPYRIPVIGWMHELEELDLDDAMHFYRRHYAPNNAILIVAGDVEVDEVRRLAESTYGRIAPNPDLGPRLRPQEPEHNTARAVTLADARITVPSMRRFWLVPQYRSGAASDAEALELLAEILGGGVRSRLYQELVVRQGIAQNVSAWYRGTALDPTSFSVGGTPRAPATLEELEAAIDAEIAKIVADGVGEAELERAKDRLVRNMIFARDSQSTMARIFGSTLTTGGTVADVLEWPERIRSVSAAQVREVAVSYLKHPTTAYLLPAETREQAP
jgi:zinc protease